MCTCAMLSCLQATQRCAFSVNWCMNCSAVLLARISNMSCMSGRNIPRVCFRNPPRQLATLSGNRQTAESPSCVCAGGAVEGQGEVVQEDC